MTVTTDLTPTPEEEQNLRWQAELIGKDVLVYVLEAVLGIIVRRPPPMTHEEWEKLVDELAK